MNWLLMSIMLLCIMAMALYAVIGVVEKISKHALPVLSGVAIERPMPRGLLLLFPEEKRASVPAVDLTDFRQRHLHHVTGISNG